MKRNETDQTPAAEPAGTARKTGRWILRGLYLLLAVFCLYLVIGMIHARVTDRKFFIFNRYSAEIVLTESMEPTVPTGSLVVIRRCPITDIRTGTDGDIVCFRAESGAVRGQNVLHRAVGTYQKASGETALYTKGDHPGARVDQQDNGLGEVTQENFYGKSVFDSLILGRVVSFLRDPINLAFIAFVIAMFVLLKKCMTKLFATVNDIRRDEREDAEHHK